MAGGVMSHVLTNLDLLARNESVALDQPGLELVVQEVDHREGVAERNKVRLFVPHVLWKVGRVRSGRGAATDKPLAPQSAFLAQPTSYLLGKLVETAMLLDETEWDVMDPGNRPPPPKKKYTCKNT